MTTYIAFAQLKGGVGKSTLAANLCGYLLEQNKKNRVLGIDGDLPQATFSAWGYAFKENFNNDRFDYKAARTPQEMISILKEVDGEFDYVVIDCPPRMAEMMNAILYVSDLVILPLSATAQDIWAVDDMKNTIQKTLDAKNKDINLRVVWNRFKSTTRTQQLREEAIEMLGYKEFKTPISDYVAYPDVIGMGTHVLAHNHAKAKEQFKKFGNEVLKALKDK